MAHSEAKRERDAQRYAEKGDEIRASARRRYASMTEEERAARRAYERDWKRRNRDKDIAQKRKRLYGITTEAYEALLEQQGGHCATCPSTVKLSVDHDHVTGAVRGILCHGCNAALGFARDDADRLRALAAYIEAFTRAENF